MQARRLWLFAAALAAGCAPADAPAPEPAPKACQAGTWDHDSDPATACQECAPACAPGATQTAACAATSDRVCTPCAEGSWDHDGDPATACQDCAPACAPGTTETTACATTSDRVCTPCAEGSWDHDGDPATACQACAPACAPGATETTACATTSDRFCTPCAEGSWDHDSDQATACQACAAACTPGQTQVQACSATTDRVCSGCAEDHYDQDQDPLTECDECAVCAHGSTQTQACTPLTDRSCQACQPGTTDVDADPLTACTDCSACPASQMNHGLCTAQTDRSCHDCTDDRHSQVPSVNPQLANPFADCPPGDPTCLQSIDLAVFYDAAALADFGGDLNQLTGWVRNAIQAANDTQRNSMLTPAQRYRLAGVRAFTLDVRPSSIGSLAAARFNQHTQSVRRSLGADISVFLVSETTGPMGYSYFLYGPTVRPERGAVIVNTGYGAHPNFCGSSRNRLLLAHELAHILGTKHNRAVLPGGSGTAYAYHNLEPYHRRNEAFGQAVSQHNLSFYTVTGYSTYRPGPNNETRSCPDCTRIPFYASPDLWWVFSEHDPLYGGCLALQTLDDGRLQLACSADDPWRVVDGSYQLNPGALRALPVAELLSRAVPLGVDQPRFTHPETQDEVVDATSSRARDTVAELWQARANAAKPLDPRCNVDCAGQHRIACAVGEQQCGACLPGYAEFADTCYPRRTIDRNDPRHDERYTPSGVFAAPSGQAQTTITLAGPSDLFRVELYLGTTDAQGAPDYAWADASAHSLNLPWAPAHRFTVEALHSDNRVTELSGFEVLNDSNNQRDSSLVFVMTADEWIEDVSGLRLTLTAEQGDYGISLLELRSFGQAR